MNKVMSKSKGGKEMEKMRRGIKDLPALFRSPAFRKNFKEKLMEVVFFIAACASILAVTLICVFIFQGGWALEQLWFFWVVPIVGGIIGGLIYRTLLEKRD